MKYLIQKHSTSCVKKENLNELLDHYLVLIELNDGKITSSVITSPFNYYVNKSKNTK